MDRFTPVKAHVLRNYRLEGWEERIVGRRHYRDLAADAHWREGRISFDSVTYHPVERQVFCGLASIDGDLLYRFDPASEQFTGLGSRRWTHPLDAKIHRTLAHSPQDDNLYFATSPLHDVDRQPLAKGGKPVGGPERELPLLPQKRVIQRDS